MFESNFPPRINCILFLWAIPRLGLTEARSLRSGLLRQPADRYPTSWVLPPPAAPYTSLSQNADPGLFQIQNNLKKILTYDGHILFERRGPWGLGRIFVPVTQGLRVVARNDNFLVSIWLFLWAGSPLGAGGVRRQHLLLQPAHYNCPQ